MLGRDEPHERHIFANRGEVQVSRRGGGSRTGIRDERGTRWGFQMRLMTYPKGTLGTDNSYAASRFFFERRKGREGMGREGKRMNNIHPSLVIELFLCHKRYLA